MNVNDIDLDVAKLLESVPKSNVVVFIRAGEEFKKDFAYIRGDSAQIADVILSLMEQNDTTADIFVAAVETYLQDE